jgi:tRNA pseudouridine38-40 synthase
MRYIIRLSYDGSAFCGWQIQNNAVTVQGELQDALAKLTGAAVQVTGAGRTDTDVNSVNYIAHFDLPDTVRIVAERLCYKLNAILPKTISIHDIVYAENEFHARFDATEREYRYFIHFTKDPFVEKFSYRMRHPLNINKMNEAAQLMLGEHDFSCFEKVGGNNTTSICTVNHACWETYRPQHSDMLGYPYHEGDYLVFTVRANRFLRNMVRAMVGSLIEVGRGKQEPGWIGKLIESGSRSDAGMSVPGKALFFCGAEYGKSKNI